MYLDKNIKEILASKLKKLNKLRPVSKSQLMKLKERFEIEMTYNSNSIEGNTLTLKETFWIIKEGITVKNKPLKDHLEATGHKEALDYLYDLVDSNKNQTISESLIKNIHSLVLQKIDKQEAGKYRNINVFITGIEHNPPSALHVKQKMKELIRWSKASIGKLHPIEFASIFHHKFVHIHPFVDGNGRVGRILMNVFIMQNRYPLCIIQKNDRKKYYRVLSLADKGNYKPLIKFIAQNVLRSLNIYLDTLIPTKEKEKFISLNEIAKVFPYSQEYLSKLARTGKIDAHKIKRNWVSSKEAIKRYMDGLNK